MKFRQSKLNISSLVGIDRCRSQVRRLLVDSWIPHFAQHRKLSFVVGPWNLARYSYIVPCIGSIGGQCSPLAHDSRMVAPSPTKRATFPISKTRTHLKSLSSHAYLTSPQHVHGPNITMANGVPIPESKILKSRDLADNDENNWAIFDLRSVEVVNKKGKLVNMLHANENNPVTVTGTLQVSKGNAELCRLNSCGYSFSARPHTAELH